MSNPWTPGPWIYENPAITHGNYEVVDPGGYVDGTIGGIPNEADARLIALAPEMAELLEKLVRGLQPAGLKPNAADLLARARGHT